MAQQNQNKNIYYIESKEENINYILPLVMLPLVRTYKAVCPMIPFCKLPRTESKDPKNRNVWHPECKHALHIVQVSWRRKIRLLKLQNITRVLMRKISKQIKPTDFIFMIYKFL